MDARSIDQSSRHSDEYRATLIATGPGLVACSLMYCVEQRTLALPLVYAAFVLASLPGLPILGFAVSRFLPAGQPRRRPELRLAWLPLVIIAPYWHIFVMDVTGVIMGGDFVFQPERWKVFIAYGAALSIATTTGWSILILKEKRL